MSYDFAVWRGVRPESNRKATEIYEDLMDRLDAGQGGPADEATEHLVSNLEEKWPADRDDSPWADEPLLGSAFDGGVYLCLVPSRADGVINYLIETAPGLGFVCFDPQSEEVLASTS